MTGAIEPNARLLRDFAVSFLTCHDSDVAARIMHPDYSLSIGGYLLAGRDSEYLPATVAQLDQFPGLCVTAHDAVLAPDAVALRFTEHGRSARDDRLSSWGGITLFRLRGGQLHRGWAEEDYYARKLQIKSGIVNDIMAPHPAPWDAPVEAPDDVTEAAMKRWLDDPASLVAASDEIAAGGPKLAQIIAPSSVEVSTIFTAGSRGAFHAVLKGEYIGGFEEIGTDARGRPIEIAVAAIVDCAGGEVARVQLSADRLGLSRRLKG